MTVFSITKFFKNLDTLHILKYFSDYKSMFSCSFFHEKFIFSELWKGKEYLQSPNPQITQF